MLFGIAGLLMAVLPALWPGLEPKPLLLLEAERAAAVYRPFSMFARITGLMLATMLCVAGVGLLDARRWGRTLSMRWSGCTIVIQLATMAVWCLDVIPHLSIVVSRPEFALLPQLLARLRLVGLAAPVLSILYAVLLLGVMLRRSTRDAFAAAAAAAAAAPRARGAVPSALLPPPLPGSPAHAAAVMAVVRAFGFSTLLIGISGLLSAAMNGVMLALHNGSWPGYELDGSIYGGFGPSPQCVAAMYGSFLGTGLLSIAAIVAGVGLHRGRPWSRAFAIRWSVCTIIFGVVCLVIWVSFPLAKLWVFWRNAENVGKIVSGFLQPFGTAFYPVLLLIVMNHPAVRAVLTIPGRAADAPS